MQKANKLKTKPRGLSPRANYTDRATAAKLVPTFADRGCHVVSVTDPYGRILGFLDRSRYFLFQIAPQLYSRG
jgi:CBS-domain-containing membrane protein